MEREDSYPSFGYKASELSAFAVALKIFIISLKSGELIRFIPDDPGRFRDWLNAHGIRDADKKQQNEVKPAIAKPKRRRFF